MYIKGMDISSLPERRDKGLQLYTADGKPIEVFDALKQNNINSIRLRIWNQPELVPQAGGYCNLEHTIQMAKEIKAHNMHFLLDFHYSDYWADPGQQRKPAAWQNLSFPELVNAVHDYTAMVLEALAKENCLPDIVQIGNEIRSGMLFPDGEVPNYSQLTALLNAGIEAVRQQSSDIQVMIHLDQGGRFYTLKDWFDSVFSAGLLPIDCIGISFYPFWHGTFMDLRDTMLQLVEHYQLPVCVVETAHPWQIHPLGHINEAQMKTAGIPAGIEQQKQSLNLIFHIIDSIPNEMGMGVYYWEPLGIPMHEQDSWARNMSMLDEKGYLLPAFDVYRDFTRGSLLCENLDVYMESLYAPDPNQSIPEGSNCIPNGDLLSGLEDWWLIKSTENVYTELREGILSFSCLGNFRLELCKDILVEQDGTYQFMVDYRGTNTTGVHVEMYIKYKKAEGETVFSQEIFPSDYDWVTHTLDALHLKRGVYQVGIFVEAPPIDGKIRNLRLIQ